MRRLITALSATLLGLPLAQAGELSNAQVEKILGVTGVTHAPSKALAIDLEYRDAAGQKLFTLRLSEPAIYETWKAGAKRAEPVAGLGQDAFAQPTLQSVCARTATTAVCANALSLTTAPRVTQPQLVALVRAAL